MNDPKRFLFFVAVLFIVSTGLLGQTTTPQQYFDQNCSSCHTIGGGAGVGPDLKGVTQRAPNRHWLVEFIRDPDSKIAAKDAYATKIAAQAEGAMTGFPDVTEEFGEALLEYIDQQSGTPAASAAAAMAGDVAHGRALFLGQQKLSNGAAACVACHQASGLPITGGRLGPDLSAAHLKLGGDRGLISWLRNPPTKVMSSVFRPAPMTAAEAADLTAFLRSTSEDPTRLTQAPLRRVQTIGLLGSLLLFVFAGVIWRGRLRGVRSDVTAKRGDQ
jgi:mono/diheme cytochrome c family protein